MSSKFTVTTVVNEDDDGGPLVFWCAGYYDDGDIGVDVVFHGCDYCTDLGYLRECLMPFFLLLWLLNCIVKCVLGL